MDRSTYPRRLAEALLRATAAAATRVVDEVMPRHCAFCGVAGEDGEGFVCRGCRADLPWNTSPCPNCASPMPDGAACAPACAACQRRPVPFFTAIAPLEYAFPVDAAIKAFKFQRRLYYAPAFGELLLSAVHKLPPDADGLLPVPLHRWRHGRRGFNQAHELARPVRTATGIPLITNVYRRRATPYQSGLDAPSRRRNLDGAFFVKGSVRARHVVLVDDVITTGETCRQLAREVLACGAERVSVLALARA